MRLFSCIGPLVYLAIAVSALTVGEPPAQDALVLNDNAVIDTIHEGTTKENIIGMGGPEGDPEGDPEEDPTEPDPDDPDGECEVGGGELGNPHADNFVCQMTSKFGRNCNIHDCRAGGGYCYRSRSGRCCGVHMRRGGRNTPFECSTNCRCKTF